MISFIFDISEFTNKFVRSSRLRSNIKLSTNYIAELFLVSHNSKLTVEGMFYKDLIIHIASVIKAILHEKVRQVGDNEQD